MAIAHTSVYPSENKSFVNLLAASFGDQTIKGIRKKGETQVSKPVRSPQGNEEWPLKRDWSLNRGIPNNNTVEPLLSGHLTY